MLYEADADLTHLSKADLAQLRRMKAPSMPPMRVERIGGAPVGDVWWPPMREPGTR